MRVNLRQGLILPKREDYLVRTATGVDVRIRRFIRVVFAHGPVNYLHDVTSGITNAWVGDFSDKKSYWFYWDISTETGKISRGFTEVEPANGTLLPSSPVVGQHFFDKTDNYMKVWNGFDWVQKIRVFAGSLKNGQLLSFGNGSQADIYGQFQAYPIRFFDVDQPVRRELDDGNFIFLVNTGNPRQDIGQIENFRLQRVDNSRKAAQNIPKNKVVVLDDNGELIPGEYTNTDKEALGITEVALSAGDTKNIVTRGFIEDKNAFNFVVPPLTPLFVGLNGDITLQIPSNPSIQKIGYVTSQHSIFVDIEPQVILIGGTPLPTPSVTPTSDVTPTVTPTSDVTPTVTPTNNVTPTVTPTSDVTPTVTPTNNVTPTSTSAVTSTPMATPTPTPTLTPSPSAASDPDILVGDAGSGDNLYLLNPDNSLKTTYTFIPTGEEVVGVVVDDSGNGYALSASQGSSVTLYKFDIASGTVAWSTTSFDSTFTNQPAQIAVDASGNVYAPVFDKVYKFNSSGVKQWDFQITSTFFASSVDVDESGNVYVGGRDAKVYKLNSSGSQTWSFTAANDVDAVAVNQDGEVFFGCRTGGDQEPFYKLNSSGVQQFNISINKSIAVSADANGNAYVGTFQDSNSLGGTDARTLYIIDNNGNIIQSATLGDNALSTSVDIHGNYYYTYNPNGGISKYNSSNANQWATTTIGTTIYSIATSPRVAAFPSVWGV